MNWINPNEQKPEEGLKVLIAAPNFTAIGYWNGKEWRQWLDFPRNGEPYKSAEIYGGIVFAWQPLPDWKHSDFNWL